MKRRIAPGGYIYHVFNRAIAKTRLFEGPDDYRAFERLLADACARFGMRLLSYNLMPNHWHLVLWPCGDGDLPRFMHWLCTTHARRWRLAHKSKGRGCVYQSRYKSFPVETGRYFIALCRYVERNALAAGLVQRAEYWRFGSLWRRMHPHFTTDVPPLCDWPGGRSDTWVEFVNEPRTKKELAAISPSLTKGRPFGSPAWQQSTAKELELESTLRRRGRPRKTQRKPGVSSSEKELGALY